MPQFAALRGPVIAVLAALAVIAGVVMIAPVAPAEARTVPVLGHAFKPYSSGFGKAHPSSTWGGGDPTSSVTKIKWRNWGSATATGTGHACWGGNNVVAGCKMQSVRVFATALARCSGKRAYQEYGWYFPSEGETQLEANVYSRRMICAKPSTSGGTAELTSYHDRKLKGYSGFYLVSWDSPDHEVRCSVGANRGLSDPLPLGCVSMHGKWKSVCPVTGFCTSSKVSGYQIGLGALTPNAVHTESYDRAHAYKAKVLPAGKSITVNGLTCTSRAHGMLCISDTDQGSFEVSKASAYVVPTGHDSYLQ